jgi:lipopolysaccharide transport system permease protein
MIVIRPPAGWELIDFKELKEYRDLFYFLVWRDIKVLYAQTILGFSWAILNPLIQIVVFSIVFGKVAKVATDGIPYFLFNTCAIIPWAYMSEAMTNSSHSLVKEHTMLGKIYFPRLLFPLTPVLAKFVDFAISLVLLAGIVVYYDVSGRYDVTFSTNLLFFPLFMILMVAVPAGLGLWLSSLAIRFRDVKFVMHYVIRLLVYSGPIVYSASSIPHEYRVVYSFNPIVTVMEGFRSCLLGVPFQWQYIVPGCVSALVLLVSGAFYFRRTERVFVDVI